ncbi:hypothetical protein [Streptomyces cyaneofuscatus]|uniref:hypothetical protein n=1 Tax=Streptomyces cyaneofuscatus TaxID=66883 RepID=UPI003822D741
MAMLARFREEASGRQRSGACHHVTAPGTNALIRLMHFRGERGHLDVERLAREDADPTTEVLRQAEFNAALGDQVVARDLAHQAAAAGNTQAWVLLSQIYEEGGDRNDAKTFAYRAANAGEWSPLMEKFWEHGLDPDETPTSPWM